MGADVPLLPNESFDRAIESLSKPIDGKNPSNAYQLFIKYVKQQYSKKHISVFGIPDRTNITAAIASYQKYKQHIY